MCGCTIIDFYISQHRIYFSAFASKHKLFPSESHEIMIRPYFYLSVSSQTRTHHCVATVSRPITCHRRNERRSDDTGKYQRGATLSATRHLPVSSSPSESYQPCHFQVLLQAAADRAAQSQVRSTVAPPAGRECVMLRNMAFYCDRKGKHLH